MLIPEGTAITGMKVVFAGWVVTTIAFFVFRARVKAARFRAHMDDLPLGASGERLVRHKRLVLAQMLVLTVLVIGGLVVAVGYSTHVAVVTGDHDVEQYQLLGSSSFDVGDKSITLGQADGSWIVNQSTEPVRIETVRYSASSVNWGRLPEDRTVTIAAHAVGSVKHKLDFFGPQDEPPRSIETRDGEFAVRYWLTW